ncbi:MAG: DUF1294 domain-containing protein [Oscillospiraceae bacterium]|nr:DUF1294 domain-containing protein [Oscillospiraceae bacterium]
MKPAIFTLLVYLVIINAAGFLLMLIDKRKARKRHWRIPESVLLGVALVGGSLGTLIGMYQFRHKTLHSQFVWGVPTMLIAHFLILVLLVFSALIH